MKNKNIEFDVRSILAGGEDPLNQIMDVVKNIKEGETLQIINTFEPIPLVHKLEELGFESKIERVDANLVHAFFTKQTKKEQPTIAKEYSEIDTVEFETIFKSFIGKMNYVDVRLLEMPEPMTTILELLEELPIGFCLHVDHKKVPQFLLPELEERGFKIVYNKKSEDHFQLLICRK